MRYFTGRFDCIDIPFWVSPEKSFVGARSIVSGIGIDWPRQYTKIKSNFNHCLMSTTDSEGRKTQILALNSISVKDYLTSISPARVKPEIRNKIKMYRERLPEFIEDQTREIDKDLFSVYTKDQSGFLKLVNDILISKPSKAVTKLSKILFAISSPESFDGDRYDVIDILLDLVEDMADSSIQNQIKKLISIA